MYSLLAEIFAYVHVDSMDMIYILVTLFDKKGIHGRINVYLGHTVIAIINEVICIFSLNEFVDIKMVEY